MSLSINNLEICFTKAKEVGANYVAVLIEMKLDKPEIIINSIENVDSKLEYYKDVYDENLNHKYADGIKIIGFTYGRSFTDIEFDLIGDED